MQRVFRVVETRELKPAGVKATSAFIRSVRRFGVVNPVLLAEVIDADGVILLAIIDGHRRICAAQSARLSKVPAVVLKATTNEDRARLTLICNYMRSANFHTESEAILALAVNEDAAGQMAKGLGLGTVRMQQLYRKIATMPEAVRRAMYEHRLPVTAATWVGAWPEGLQRELIELLDRRRYVNTTMIKDLREWYVERHPEEFAVAEPVRPEAPLDEWSDSSLHDIAIPAPPAPYAPVGEHGVARTEPAAIDPGLASSAPLNVGSSPEMRPEMKRSHLDSGSSTAGADEAGGAWENRDPGATSSPGDDRAETLVAPAIPDTGEPFIPSSPDATPAVKPSWAMTQSMAGRSPVNIFVASADSLAPATAGQMAIAASATVGNGVPESAAPVDDRAERLVAFVVRLDAAMRELAREGRELGIDRAVWVDRTMRAWDGIGT